MPASACPACSSAACDARYWSRFKPPPLLVSPFIFTEQPNHESACTRRLCAELSTAHALLLHCRCTTCRQPMVPVIDAADGRWLLTAPGKVMMKPGGHGAIWKLMHDQGERMNCLDMLPQKTASLSCIIELPKLMHDQVGDCPLLLRQNMVGGCTRSCTDALAAWLVWGAWSPDRHSLCMFLARVPAKSQLQPSGPPGQPEQPL
eukprot:GHRQ01028768.1.p1 GENE.GHRQ01028768.1~~GHRQ01028768.1.p1  ORF type:complete len:204 (-),score=27.69 GHRQ01028768.1:143-754(-)